MTNCCVYAKNVVNLKSKKTLDSTGLSLFEDIL